ncbi:MAG TPA: HAMP domain-containing sensor histidine kinase [Actinomycetota bacterium]|nr:HAMP domain-containing sensor histidine kinase [Actinomycetota bacterium]
MTFRARITLAAALAVAVTVVAVAFVAFLVLRRSLAHGVDSTLRARSSGLTLGVASGDPDAPHDILGDMTKAAGLAQVVSVTGSVMAPVPPTLPVPPGANQVASGRRRSLYATVGPEDNQVRVYLVPLPGNSALEVGLLLDEYHRSLQDLAIDLSLVACAGILVAGVGGWFVAHTALVPLHRLTASIGTMAETTDLSHRVEVRGGAELERLATDFNQLVDALEQSQAKQRQLVTDASHELRTPLTSLRTNIEVLQRSDELDPAERESLRRDVLAQMDELTQLVGDVVELARGDLPEAGREAVDLDELVVNAVARAEVHARATGVQFRCSLEPSQVWAAPTRLERAVANLLDNAVKWSPLGGVVEVSSQHGAVVVRDHGPGIPAGDLTRIFDRFYRASAARGRPGSGLGLAIVREVVHGEGGTVEAVNDPGGGAVFRIQLPER